MHFWKWRKPDSKDYIWYNLISMTFSKGQKYREGEQISGYYQGLGEVERTFDYKEVGWTSIWGKGAVLFLILLAIIQHFVKTHRTVHQKRFVLWYINNKNKQKLLLVNASCTTGIRFSIIRYPGYSGLEILGLFFKKQKR